MSTRTHIKSHATALMLMDVACLAVGCFFGILWRFPPAEWMLYFETHTTHWLVLFGSILLANIMAGSYRVQYTYSRFNLVVTWLFSLAFAVVLMTLASYMRMINPLGRGVLWRIFLVYSVLILALKLSLYRRIFRSSAFVCRTVILGTGKQAGLMKIMLENNYVLPRHKVVAYIDIHAKRFQSAGEKRKDGTAVISCEEDNLEQVVRSLGADLIVVALDDVRDAYVYYPRLRKLRFDGIEILIDKNAAELYCGRTPLEHLDEEMLMEVSMQSGLPTVRQVKRLWDIVLSLTGLVLASPIMVLVALVVKLSDVRSPIMYTQTRVGQFGRPFRIYKFRTMLEGAEDGTGAVWARGDDPRITRTGRILRKFRLDEMPQLINILKGEMSIVGPRPERPEFSAELGEQIQYYHERENVPPGLTGWAQVRHPYGDSLEHTKKKLEFDLFYIKNMSLSLDLQIILSTIRIVVLGMEREH